MAVQKKPSMPLVPAAPQSDKAKLDTLVHEGYDRAELEHLHKSGKIVFQPTKFYRGCPKCGTYTRDRNVCPVCETQLPPSENAGKSRKKTMTPNDYKRLSRVAGKFRSKFKTAEEAKEALEAAEQLLHLCHGSIDEAASWLADEDDQD